MTSTKPEWPDRLVVRPLTQPDAEQMAAWRYEGQWKIYDFDDSGGLLTAEDGVFAVAGADGGPLVGSSCIGEYGRVPGMTADPTMCDLGVAMSPCWVGQGKGVQFLIAVLTHTYEFARAHDMVGIRCVYLAWNDRAFRVTKFLGFTQIGTHRCEQAGRENEYVVLYQDLDSLEYSLSHKLARCLELASILPT